MTGSGRDFASAGRNDQRRPLTASERLEYDEHVRLVNVAIARGDVDGAPRFRLQIVSGHVLDGPEHGMAGVATLCGIPESEVFVMRHLFHPAGPFACGACREASGQLADE